MATRPKKQIKVIPGSASGAPLLYVDGVQNMNFSAIMAKLQLFQIDHSSGEDGPERIEHRRVVQILALPSSILVDFCITTLKSLSTNVDALERVGSDQSLAMIKNLRGLAAHLEGKGSEFQQTPKSE